MKTKTLTVNQQALAAAIALRDSALVAQHDAKVAFDIARANADAQKTRVTAIKAVVLQDRKEAAAVRALTRIAREQARADRAAARAVKAQEKAERRVRAQARKDAAVAKAEARLAKARERAQKPVGIVKSKMDRKPGKATVIVPSTTTAVAV